MIFYEILKYYHKNEPIMYKDDFANKPGWWIINKNGNGEEFLGNDITGYIGPYKELIKQAEMHENMKIYGDIGDLNDNNAFLNGYTK